MKKHWGLIAATAMALAIAFAFVGCGSDSSSSKDSYPDFKPGTSTVAPDDGSGTLPSIATYTISTVSKGGLALNGVGVAAYKGTTLVAEGLSSGGKIQLTLAPDDYTLSFTSLPDGYKAPTETVTLGKRDYLTETKVTFTSSVIETTTGSTNTYSVGDVMHDFAYTEVEDYINDGYTSSVTEHKKTLSSFFDAGYRAVVLNFWYVNCSWCNVEFPYLEQAYEQYSDKLAIIAVNNTDSPSAIATYKTDKVFNDTIQLTFDMAVRDEYSLTKQFSVTGFPTTVVIDRYGVVASIHASAITSIRDWITLFDTFTSDNYTQDIEDSGDDTTTEEVPRIVPDVDYPEDGVINTAAVNTAVTSEQIKLANITEEDSTDNDYEWNWPWVADVDEKGLSYIKPTNVGKDQYSWSIMNITVNLKAGDVLQFDYNVNTSSGLDVVYILIDGASTQQLSGSSDGWATMILDISDREKTLDISFTYLKQASESANDEFVMLRNFNITSVNDLAEPTDTLVSVVGNPAADGKKFDSYPTDKLYKNSKDGYYYISSVDGNDQILLFDIRSATAWTDLHIGEKYAINDEGSSYLLTLWYIIYWQFYYPEQDKYYDESTNENVLTVMLNNTDYTRTLTWYYELANWSTNYMLPVNDELKAFIDDFCREYASRNDGVDYYEEQWLEFCYVYKHYGTNHTEGNCLRDQDPIKGLEVKSALTATVGENTVNVNVTRQTNRGTRFVFSAPTAGVYWIYSTNSDATITPSMYILDSLDNAIAEYDGCLDYFGLSEAQWLNNFSAYVYLEQWQTIYLSLCVDVGGTGTYTFNIERIGDTANKLLVCTTAGGMWIGTSETDAVYGAIDVIYDKRTDCYYSVVNNEKSSKVYIDFIHPSFFSNNSTLLSLIERNEFNYSSLGGGDYTGVMMNYYQQAISGKDESDELYGMIEASSALVDELNYYLSIKYGTYDNDQNAWLAFACYYAYYGPAD